MKVTINPTISPVFNNHSTPVLVPRESAGDFYEHPATRPLSAAEAAELRPRPRVLSRAVLVTILSIAFTAAWHATGWSANDVAVYLSEKAQQAWHVLSALP